MSHCFPLHQRSTKTEDIDGQLGQKQDWSSFQNNWEPNALVSIFETSANVNMM